jgi:hypothetical protein
VSASAGSSRGSATGSQAANSFSETQRAGDGTAARATWRSSRYWRVSRSLVRMLTLDLRGVSARIAKIASRTSSLIVVCPPGARSQRSSA